MKLNCNYLKVWVLAGVICAATASSQGQVVGLIDNNSTAAISLNSQAGMYSWTVDGVNQLFQQWFWYRIGNDPASHEYSIDTISTPSISGQTPSSVTTTYSIPTYNVSIKYSLAGGNAGSGLSSMTEQIAFNNTSTNVLSLHFFQYSDFDLSNDPNGDMVALGKNNQGLFNEALQTKGSISLSEVISDTGITPGANHGEVNYFANTLNSLNDSSPTTLNDVAGPLGPGDVTWAFEWDVTLNPGGSLLISKVKNLQVPEPSSIALLSLGIAACAIFRRRSSA